MMIKDKKAARRQILLIFFFGLIPTLGTSASAQSLSPVDGFFEQYAEIQLLWSADADREGPLTQLLEQAEAYRDAHPGAAEAWVATARIRFGYADTQGIVRGVRLMKTSRDELEHALTLDPAVRNGFAQAFLGYLYVGMPPWPLGFRDREKGVQLLEDALRINPDGMEINYYFAEYYGAEKDYGKALEHVERARAAADDALPQMRRYYLRSIDATYQKLLQKI
ncbi:MAG: hypothetical protein RQ757_06110 [Pseudomonadales bacterium]|nr:hypothetical protein [Pseudomonadales bacterium]